MREVSVGTISFGSLSGAAGETSNDKNLTLLATLDGQLTAFFREVHSFQIDVQ